MKTTRLRERKGRAGVRGDYSWLIEWITGRVSDRASLSASLQDMGDFRTHAGAIFRMEPDAIKQHSNQ